MAQQTAKSSFSKSEIIEILKTNVNLYKNEPEFVEYIVNLALFLIDQAYCNSGERSADLDSIMMFISGVDQKSTDSPSHELSQPPKPRVEPPKKAASESLTSLLELDNQSVDESDSEISEIDSEFDSGEETSRKPVSRKLQDSKFEPIMKLPPPVDGNQEETRKLEISEHFHEPKTDGLKEEDIEEIKRQSRDSNKRPKFSDPHVKQYRSMGENTPIPSSRATPPDDDEVTVKEPREKTDQNPESSLGKARVYKVIRTYKKNASSSDNCPICSAYTKGRAVCPSCGHIL